MLEFPQNRFCDALALIYFKYHLLNLLHYVVKQELLNSAVIIQYLICSNQEPKHSILTSVRSLPHPGFSAQVTRNPVSAELSSEVNLNSTLMR